MNKFKLFLGASILLAVSAQANENLIINGGFEEPLVLDQILNYEYRIGTELTGWEVFSDSSGTVHFNSNYALVSEGNQAAQLEFPDDGIAQDFVTIPNKLYTLSLDVSAFLRFVPNSFLGISVGLFSTQVIGSADEYETHTFTFLANSTITTLTLTNQGAFGTFPHVDNVSIVPTATPVTIDIKPGSDPVCNGVIPIAILGSDTLDVIQIDQTTLSFEGKGVRVSGNGALSCNIRDANRDGYDDLICRYEDTTTKGALTGELLDGTLIEGADTLCLGN